jgi:hypothetical protein
VFPFAVGDTFTYQYDVSVAVATSKGTTTTPASYVQTTTIESPQTFNGVLVYPFHTTGKYTSSGAPTTVDDLEYRNWVASGGRWYYAAYSFDETVVTHETNGTVRYRTEKKTYPTPFYYDILPETVSSFAEPAGAVESWDDHYQIPGGVSNLLNYTRNRAEDGSLTERGTDVTTPYNYTLAANGTGTEYSGPPQGGVLWTFGAPHPSGSKWVIPATETYDGQNGTNEVPDWYPGHAQPVLPLATNSMADFGKQPIPSGCGKWAGKSATHLQLNYRQLDSVGGFTYDETDDYYIVAGPGRVCRLDNIVETDYDRKHTGAVTTTTTTKSSEALLSEKLVAPPALALSKSALTFTALGASAKQSFTASESGYKDALTVASSNPGVATVSAATIASGGTIAVTPVSGGKATIVVTDASQQAKSLTVAVTGATLTLHDVPARTLSVKLSTVNGKTSDAVLLALKPSSAGCTTAKAATTCVVSAGVLPGTDELTLQTYSGAGATGTLLSHTSVAASFKAATQNAFEVSGAAYLASYRVSGAGIGSLTAGAAGDPHVYFVYAPASKTRAIAQMTAAGAYGSYLENPIGEPALAPGKAASGEIWFASRAALGSLTTAGKATLYKTTIGTCKSAYVPYSLALGPDGNPWFTEAGCGRYGIGTLAAGKIANYLFPLDPAKKPAFKLSAATQRQIVTGHDGNLWFVTVSCGLVATSCVGPPQYAVGRITPKGVLTYLQLKLPVTCAAAYLAPGGDGSVWFATCAPGAKKSTVLRITAAGVVTAFAGLTTVANDLIEGSDGNLYFTDLSEIGRLTTTGSQVGRVDYYYPTLGVASTNSIGLGNDGFLYATNASGYVDKVELPAP